MEQNKQQGEQQSGQRNEQLKTNELPSTKVSVRQDEAEAYMKEEVKRVESVLADLNARTEEFGLSRAIQERLEQDKRPVDVPVYLSPMDKAIEALLKEGVKDVLCSLLRTFKRKMQDCDYRKKEDRLQARKWDVRYAYIKRALAEERILNNLMAWQAEGFDLSRAVQEQLAFEEEALKKVEQRSKKILVETVNE